MPFTIANWDFLFSGWAHELLPSIVHVCIFPFEIIVRKSSRSSLGKHLKKYAWTFLFQHHLIFVFWLSLCSAKILCMPKLNGFLVFYLPCYPLFWMSLNFFQHHFSNHQNHGWILCWQQMIFALWQTLSLLT